MSEKVTVISLGGSIVAPEGADGRFLRDFAALLGELLQADEARRFVLVVGGGGPARAWQGAYRDAVGEAAIDDEADWIGIMATRLNAQLVRAALAKWCRQEVVTDPTVAPDIEGRVLVAAGWKPGFSSDYDATLLAERFGAKTVINLSNIEKVYTADPRVDPSARPLDEISWKDFRAMVGEEWTPGKNVPFDPVASRHASESGIKVICAAGRNLENLRAMLCGGDFVGTVIGGRAAF
ncbi:MAG: UMP kinase [Treponema sp.]|nr:UMP kinase [Treponema sp.]